MELMVDDMGREPGEDGLDLVPGLRGREGKFAAVGPCELRDLPLPELRARHEVRLVHREDDRYLADDLLDAVDPVVEFIEGPPAGHVGHGEDPVRPVEVGVFQKLAEALLAHDVPDHEDEVDLEIPFRRGHMDLLLRDACADRRDVVLFEHVGHEAADEGRLPDALVADEAYFRLELFRDQRAPAPKQSRLRRWLLNASWPVLANRCQLATEMPSRWRTMVPSRLNRDSTFSPVLAEV